MTSKEAHARGIAARLQQAGHVAYLAGGCVRDRLLGREPQDFDIATDATAEVVQNLFPRTVPVGAQFGVVLVMIDGDPFEVATFRADAEYADGRHPTSVRFSTPEEDAQRRDFTINGMFLDPRTDEIIDFVGGRADLARGLIRAIGSPSDRISEDRLRMLRAVRFAARFGFAIEEDTWNGIRAHAPQIVDISWERIGDEIVKILVDSPPGGARRGFELLDGCGLLRVILPEIDALHGVEQSPDYHPEGDVFIHTMGLLARLDRPSETLALAALLHDVAKPQCAERKGERITFYGHCEIGAEVAVRICQRLKRSRQTWERVEYLVRHHLRLVSAMEMRTSTLKRFLREDGIEELLELARLDALAASGNLTHYEFCKRKLEELGDEELRPEPWLKGSDLIAAGLSPGPHFKELLQAALDAQLEGELTTKEQALTWLQSRLQPNS